MSVGVDVGDAADTVEHQLLALGVAEITASEEREVEDEALELLAAMAEGRTNAGIAELLSITEGAAEKHISNIFSKLDLPGTVDGTGDTVLDYSAYTTDIEVELQTADENSEAAATGLDSSQKAAKRENKSKP